MSVIGIYFQMVRRPAVLLAPVVLVGMPNITLGVLGTRGIAQGMMGAAGNNTDAEGYHHSCTVGATPQSRVLFNSCSQSAVERLNRGQWKDLTNEMVRLSNCTRTVRGWTSMRELEQSRSTAAWLKKRPELFRLRRTSAWKTLLPRDPNSPSRH